MRRAHVDVVQAFLYELIMQLVLKQKNLFLLLVVFVFCLACFFALVVNAYQENQETDKTHVSVVKTSMSSGQKQEMPSPEKLDMVKAGMTKKVMAQDIPALGAIEAGGLLAHIQLNSPSELKSALERAEVLYQEGKIRKDDNPVAFVLHGPEVSVFLKQNYSANQTLVDLAAKLSALNVIDVKVCQTRLGMLEQTESDLAPFVGTVPFGPAEVSRLVNDEEYIYF